MMTNKQLDLIVAGVGGQGSLFASQVVGQAAFHENLPVRIAESYGVAQRGGSVYSQIRIGNEVCGPLIPGEGCELILGLEPIEALRRATEFLAPGGSVVLNTHIQDPLETKMGRQPQLNLPTIRQKLRQLGAGKILEVDAMKLAMEAGGPPTVNVVMLGALLSIDRFPLAYESVAKAIEIIGKPAFLDMNLRSLSKGRQFGEQHI